MTKVLPLSHTQQLWHAYQAGDEEALSALYAALGHQLYHYGCRQTQDTALAEDAVQELFCRLWQRSRSASEVKNIQNYLSVSIRNYIRKQMINAQRQSEWEAGCEFPQAFYPEGAGNDNQPRIRQLRRALESLPERQREVLQLRYLEGFDYTEISGIMDISYQVARNYASRGLKRLRAQWPADCLSA